MRNNKLVYKAIIADLENVQSSTQAVLDSFLGCLIIHSSILELKNGRILITLILKQDI